MTKKNGRPFSPPIEPHAMGEGGGGVQGDYWRGIDIGQHGCAVIVHGRTQEEADTRAKVLVQGAEFFRVRRARDMKYHAGRRVARKGTP